MPNELSAAHERYSRLFVRQRIQDVFNRIDKNKDDCIDEHELFEYLEILGYPATQAQVRDMVWEVDDKSEGYLTLESITELLKRLHKAKARGVGTGSNLLRNLFEYMIFDTDFSGAIDVEEVQQMFFVYYGFKGNLLDKTVRDFQKLRAHPDEEITFEEFSHLMDKLSLKPALQERVTGPPKRRRIMPKLSRTPRGTSNNHPISPPRPPPLEVPPSRAGPSGALTARFRRSSPLPPSPAMARSLALQNGLTKTEQGTLSAMTERLMRKEAAYKLRREAKFKKLSGDFLTEYEQYKMDLRLAAAEEKQVQGGGMRLGNI